MESPSHTKRDQNIYYWIIIVVLIIFSLIGGLLGFHHYFIQNYESSTWVRAFYRTLQLFTLENGDLQSPFPWILQVVRFTAPLTAIMAIVLAIVAIFRERWRKIRISRLKNHVIIIGLGTKGKNLLEENIRKNEKILVVEKDPLNPNLESLKQKHCHLIRGDATSTAILKRTRPIHAKSIYLLMGDDALQVKSCLLLYRFVKESHRNKDNPVKCFLHLLKREHLNALKSHVLVEDENDGLDLKVFNVYENSARELFQSYPPDRDGIRKESQDFVQMIIFGFGDAGEALALQTTLTGHYLNRESKLPKVIIFDREAEVRTKDFLNRYPDFTKYCDLESEQIEAKDPQLITKVAKYLEEPDALCTVVLCFDNKTNNLLLGFQIDDIEPESESESRKYQVFIRTDDNESLDVFSTKIKAYGLPSNICSEDAILGENLDKMAMYNHLVYLRVMQSITGSSAKKEWEKLSQEFKDSNRKAADHIGVKIRGLGYKIISEEKYIKSPDLYAEVDLDAEQIELLARLEHVRWFAERSLAGWTFNTERNDNKKRTPKLVPWEELDKETRDGNMLLVKHIPDVLAEVNLKIVELKKDAAK